MHWHPGLLSTTGEARAVAASCSFQLRALARPAGKAQQSRGASAEDRAGEAPHGPLGLWEAQLENAGLTDPNNALPVPECFDPGLPWGPQISNVPLPTSRHPPRMKQHSVHSLRIPSFQIILF